MFNDRSGVEERPKPPFNLLFLCTHNSARSLMAEAILNRRAFVLDRPRILRAFSAGDHPSAQPHPLTLELLKGLGYATMFAKPMNWSRFAKTDAPDIHLILQVCDREPDAPSPSFARTPAMLRWPTPDPVAAGGDAEARRGAFIAVYRLLERRIDALIAALNGAAPELDEVERIVARIGEEDPDAAIRPGSGVDLTWPARAS